MNKIEELEAQLMAERIKVQIDLKEKYKWVIGKYVKHDDSFMIRIDDICHVHTSCMNGYADNLEPDELLQQKRRAYYLSDEGFEEYKKFLSDPDQKKFCFKGYYYVEVKEQDDKELSGLMGRVVYE